MEQCIKKRKFSGVEKARSQTLYNIFSFAREKPSWAAEFFRNDMASCLHSYDHINEAQPSTKMYINFFIFLFLNAEFAFTIYRDKLSNLLLQHLFPTFPSSMKRHSFLKMEKENQSLQEEGFGKQNLSVPTQTAQKRS